MGEKRKHFISVLGTSLYCPVVYGDGSSNKKDSYVQVALLRKLREDLGDNPKVSILLTEKARKTNWEDRELTDIDAKISSNWNDVECRGNTKKGLESCIKEEFGSSPYELKGVGIPDGKDDDEIMKIFTTIYDLIEDGDEIIFDITHSFRSIPMIIMAVLRYAKAMKDCSLMGIYYGAFEAQENGVAPIIDLSKYNEIQEWSFASEQFAKYGNALPIKDLCATTLKQNKEEKNIANTMINLSDCIMASRGSSTGGTDNDNHKKSIRLAYDKFKNMKLDALFNPPLENLINKAKEKYKALDEKKQNWEFGMAVVKLCIDFQMINQGFTALAETINTYICEKYLANMQLDEMKTRNMADIIIGATIAYNENKKPNDQEADKMKFFTEENKISAEEYCKLHDSDKVVVKNAYANIPEKFINISNEIKGLRNDINHFGMRSQPKTSRQLRGKLTDLYKKAEEAMNNANK